MFIAQPDAKPPVLKSIFIFQTLTPNVANSGTFFRFLAHCKIYRKPPSFFSLDAVVPRPLFFLFSVHQFLSFGELTLILFGLMHYSSAVRDLICHMSIWHIPKCFCQNGYSVIHKYVLYMYFFSLALSIKVSWSHFPKKTSIWHTLSPKSSLRLP